MKFSHPEVIVFGLSSKTIHAVINSVGDLVKSGVTIKPDKQYTDFFETGRAEFINVDPLNLQDYFGYAIDFYSTTKFPTIQLVWTDRNDKFPWEPNFEEEFIYKQPLLDRNATFKFREPKNLATFTTRQWLELQKPILRVVHETDGDWQFLTGDQESEDIKIVALEQLALRDQTLNSIFNLDYGEQAEREFVGGAWSRGKISNDE
jgi:hypothetical protein